MPLTCKLCGKDLEDTALHKLTFVSGIGHFCEKCIKEIRMKMGYGGIPDMTIPQEQMDELLKQQSDGQIGKNCLGEAQKIINGNRQNDYGTPEDSFERIADYWNSYLVHNGIAENDNPLFAKDVAMMMVLFKIARLEHSYTHDSCVDICGYTAILDSMYKDSEYEETKIRG